MRIVDELIAFKHRAIAELIAFKNRAAAELTAFKQNAKILPSNTKYSESLYLEIEPHFSKFGDESTSLLGDELTSLIHEGKSNFVISFFRLGYGDILAPHEWKDLKTYLSIRYENLKQKQESKVMEKDDKFIIQEIFELRSFHDDKILLNL